VDAGDAGNLPSSECLVVIERQLISSVSDEVVANVEFPAPSRTVHSRRLSKNSWKHHLWFVAAGVVLVDLADCVQLD
jgi:hypothetical protein